MSKVMAIRFDNDIIERLTNLAKMTDRPKSYYIKKAVSEKLDDMEEIYMAESRLENLRAGKSSTISLDEMKTKYDL